MDTDDLVQEAVGNAFRRMDKFEPRRKRAIRSYLRQSIRNRILDEVRRAGKVEVSVPTGHSGTWVAPETSPLERAISAENIQRYRQALKRLEPDDQELIVGRVDLDYSYDQLALATSRPSRDAARVAVRRALLRLAQEMDAA